LADEWHDEEDLLEDLKEAVRLSRRKLNPLTGRWTTRIGSIAWGIVAAYEFVVEQQLVKCGRHYRNFFGAK
jgi:hypothetical protein